MYRLMRSDRFILDHLLAGLMSSYRQTEISHFERFSDAHEACEVANDKGRHRHYVVNESGQEYYDDPTAHCCPSIRTAVRAKANRAR